MTTLRLILDGDAHEARLNDKDDVVCPRCGHDDVAMWADDGEAWAADWWGCETFSGGCGATGAVTTADDTTRTLNGLAMAPVPGAGSTAAPLLAGLVARGDEKRKSGAARFSLIDRDECMLCHAYGADKRSLFIDCWYAIDEVVPEALDIHDVLHERGRGFYLLICKSCRARLLGKLQDWRQECILRRGVPKDHDGNDWYEPERNIPVRVNGATEMMTEDEYHAWKSRNDTTTNAERSSPGSEV